MVTSWMDCQDFISPDFIWSVCCSGYVTQVCQECFVYYCGESILRRIAFFWVPVSGTMGKLRIFKNFSLFICDISNLLLFYPYSCASALALQCFSYHKLSHMTHPCSTPTFRSKVTDRYYWLLSGLMSFHIDCEWLVTAVVKHPFL